MGYLVSQRPSLETGRIIIEQHVNRGSIRNVTIVGAGAQGSMLAFRCVTRGKAVSLFDIDEDALALASQRIEQWLIDLPDENASSGQFVQQARIALSMHADLTEALTDAELVLENVPERLALKQSVWAEIDRLAPPQALLATNSSSLRSSEIGQRVVRKDKTFNVNFHTPTKDDFVEVMWNEHTSADTKEVAVAFLKSIGSIPIITSREISGFALNRVWRAVKKECLRLWSEGYISPKDFDRGFMLEWHTEYGPFRLMDRVGLDVIRDIELNYYRESGDSSDLPPQALEEMIARGEMGEKSGKGFFEYPDPAYGSAEWLRGAQSAHGAQE